ncbi:MAG: hypothetical protein NTW06_00800 [Candidatus Falkowbacteria bacterium]|nr:hypothetical protein [Candidatus Falkowbacteria bacterium]
MEGGKKKNNKQTMKKEGKKKRVNLQVKVKKEKKNIFEPGENGGSHDDSQLEFFLPRAEKDKTIMLWGGVIFFMVIIIVCWAITFTAGLNRQSTSEGKSGFNWEKINQLGEELNKNFDSTKNQIEEMKNILKIEALLRASSTANLLASSTKEEGSSSAVVPNLSSEEIKNIKEKIIQLENNSTDKNK